MAKGDTDGMASEITDEMLDEYAVTATWDDLGARLADRYRGMADRVFSYGPCQGWIGDAQLERRWQSVAATVRATT